MGLSREVAFLSTAQRELVKLKAFSGIRRRVEYYRRVERGNGR